MTSDSELYGLKFGDWLNIVSLFITFGGFVWTITTSTRAARAANEAKQEARLAAARSEILRASTALGEIQSSIEYLRVLNRNKIHPDVLLLHYSNVARNISQQINNDGLQPENKVFLQEYLIEIRDMESGLEEARQEPKSFDAIAVNKRLVSKLDKVIEILSKLRDPEDMKAKGRA